MKLKSIPRLLLLPALTLLLAGCNGDTDPLPTYTSVLPTATQVPSTPTPTATPAPTPTVVTSLPSPIFYTVRDIFEVPVVEWFIYEDVFSSFNCHYPSMAKGCAIHFRTLDVYYFLFNPPNATEHPNDEAFQTKFETWLTDHGPITVAQIASKILEVSNTLTLWQTGGQSALAGMSEEQVGHLRVFHPLFPNSPWNQSARCQQNPVTDQSESFCRWRTVTQIKLAGGRIIGTFQQAIASTINEINTVYQSQGKGYAEMLAGVRALE